MKKLTRREFTAAGIIAAMSATTAFVSGCNRSTSVYGPPEDYDPEENEVETLYGPPDDYEPTDNELVDVYGPPADEFFDEDTELSDRASDRYDPDDNEIAPVYGPPPED